MAAKIIETVYEIISSKPHSKNNTSEIRVVSWNKYPPVIEKRKMYKKPDEDEVIIGKATGFNLAEFEMLIENADKIKKLLASAPPTDEQIAANS